MRSPVSMAGGGGWLGQKAKRKESVSQLLVPTIVLLSKTKGNGVLSGLEEVPLQGRWKEEQGSSEVGSSCRHDWNTFFGLCFKLLLFEILY